MITETADGTEIDGNGKPVTTTPVAKPPEPRPSPSPKRSPSANPIPSRTQARGQAQARAEAGDQARESSLADAQAPADDGARARALLEGKPGERHAGRRAPPPSPRPRQRADSAGRFIVQVGAFADAGQGREVRQKLEKAGLKTYVQRGQDGRRRAHARARWASASRAEADKAAGTRQGPCLVGRDPHVVSAVAVPCCCCCRGPVRLDRHRPGHGIDGASALGSAAWCSK